MYEFYFKKLLEIYGFLKKGIKFIKCMFYMKVDYCFIYMLIFF